MSKTQIFLPRSKLAQEWPEIFKNLTPFVLFFTIIFYIGKYFWRMPKKIKETEDKKKRLFDHHYYLSSGMALAHAPLCAFLSIWIPWTVGTEYDRISTQQEIWLTYVPLYSQIFFLFLFFP